MKAQATQLRAAPCTLRHVRSSTVRAQLTYRGGWHGERRGSLGPLPAHLVDCRAGEPLHQEVAHLSAWGRMGGHGAAWAGLGAHVGAWGARWRTAPHAVACARPAALLVGSPGLGSGRLPQARAQAASSKRVCVLRCGARRRRAPSPGRRRPARGWCAAQGGSPGPGSGPRPRSPWRRLGWGRGDRGCASDAAPCGAAHEGAPGSKGGACGQLREPLPLVTFVEVERGPDWPCCRARHACGAP